MVDAGVAAIATDAAAIEVLLTAANVDHAANEVLLGTIDADTNAFNHVLAAYKMPKENENQVSMRNKKIVNAK